MAPMAEEEDPVERREFMAGAASALFVPSPKTTPFHDPSFVRGLTTRTARIHTEVGGDSLSAAVVKQARKIHSAALNGGKELQLAASDYMRWGSYVLRQSGHNREALNLAGGALNQATLANNQEKQAIAYFALSLNAGTSALKEEGRGATFRGDSSKAVMYARRGLSIPDMSDETRAYLNASLARGLANVPGHERAARAAVDQALSVESLPAIDRADITGISGNALRDVGAHREALRTLQEARQFSGPISPFLHVRDLGGQILLSLDMRDASQAAALMDEMLYVIPLVDSTKVSRQVDLILRATEPWSTVREVREARERIQATRLV